MRMKKLIVLAMSAAVISPITVLAVNQPDNVGSFDLLGNIVANSPMWQWTVNDYPGPRLDVKPSEAITENGTTIYKLNGQKFIAASAYLPSFNIIAVNNNASSVSGLHDKVTFTDSTGSYIRNITNLTKGEVSFTIDAIAKNASGDDIHGVLKLTSTELRARRSVVSNASNNSVLRKEVTFIASTSMLPGTINGSCFTGVGSYTDLNGLATGSASNPVAGSEVSATSFAALINAFNLADSTGNVPRYDTYSAPRDIIEWSNRPCAGSTFADGFTVDESRDYRMPYLSAAHVVELLPTTLEFGQPIVGAWSATLNVTAYQL